MPDIDINIPIIIPYGQNKWDTCWIRDSSDNDYHITDFIVTFNLYKGYNEISNFEVRLVDITTAEKVYIREGNKIMFFMEEQLFLKGVIRKVNYITENECIISGYGSEIILKDKTLDKVDYDTTPTDTRTIVTTTVSNDLSIGRNDSYGTVAIRFQYQSKLEGLMALANTIGYQWWISHGSTSKYLDTDYFNIGTEKSQAGIRATFRTGGTSQNSTIATYSKDTEQLVNWIKVIGVDDAISTIMCATSPYTTELVDDITTVGQTTWYLKDAFGWPDYGFVKMGRELIQYSRIANFFEINADGRGAPDETGDRTVALTHKKGIFCSLYADDDGATPIYYTTSSPQTGSSIATNGLKEITLVDRSVKTTNTSELCASYYMKYFREPIETIEVEAGDEYDFKLVDIGDSVRLIDSDLNINGVFRVRAIRRIHEGTMTRHTFTLINRPLNFLDLLEKIRLDTEMSARYATAT